MLKSNIEGNVNEILFVGVERIRGIEERVDTESREASSATGFGNCLSGFAREIMIGSDRGGGAESDEESGGDGGGDDEKDGEYREKDEASFSSIGSGSSGSGDGKGFAGGTAGVCFVESAIAHIFVAEERERRERMVMVDLIVSKSVQLCECVIL